MKAKPTLVEYINPRTGCGHVGYLVRSGYKWTRIRRILPYNAVAKRTCITVKTADTKAVTL